jgi:hypothetical protein
MLMAWQAACSVASVGPGAASARAERADNRIASRVSRSGIIWDKAATERLFSPLKTEPMARSPVEFELKAGLA